MEAVHLMSGIAALLVFGIGAIVGWLLYRKGSQRVQAEILEQQQEQAAVQAQLRAEMAQLQARSAQLEQRAAEAEQQRAVAEARLSERDTALTQLRETHQQIAAEHAALSAKLAARERDYINLQTSTAEQIAMLKDAKEQLSGQFEQLANRIFDEKNRQFQLVSQTKLDLSLKPFRDQLQDFRSRVDHIYAEDAKERGALKAQLDSLQELNRHISVEAKNLTRALKGDNKAQGNWGEVILERVLEESGLRKGHEYFSQQSFTDEDGRRRQPDVIVRLPDNKDIVIDAKVSLLAYERYCSAEEEGERQLALREHIQSVKQHIAGLSTKAYQHIEELRSLDFVFIFIPIEAAFMAAFEHDAELFRQAYEQNIIVVGPTTLLATLRTVQSIWRYERQNLNAEKIAREAGGLYDQFVLVLNALEEVGKHLKRTEVSYDKTLDRLQRGRGNLVGRISKLESLGAKVKKKIPAAYSDSDDSDALPSPKDEDE